MKAESSNTQTSPGKLATTLIVTALCSQLPYIGILAAFFAFFMSEGGPMNTIPQPLSASDVVVLSILWIVPFAILSIGPVFLSLYFNRNLRGFKNGLLTSITLIGCFVITWHIYILKQPYPVSASIAVAFLLIVNGKIRNKSDFMGLALAILIGFILSLGIVPMVEQTSLLFTNIPMLSLWIWLSAVFFPELFSRRTDWRGALVYILVMVIATSIIYFVYPH